MSSASEAERDRTCKSEENRRQPGDSLGPTRRGGVIIARNGRRETELRLSIDADFLRELQDKLGVDRATDVARAALTILNWAAGEASRGRVILSSITSGEDIHRLVMPELTTAARRC